MYKCILKKIEQLALELMALTLVKLEPPGSSFHCIDKSIDRLCEERRAYNLVTQKTGDPRSDRSRTSIKPNYPEAFRCGRSGHIFFVHGVGPTQPTRALYE